MRCLMLAGLLLIVGARPAAAVVVADNSSSPGNPASHTVAPADSLGDPGWANIGWRGFGTDAAAGATAVYLGNRYVLTANHVGAGPVTFGTDDPSGGTTYQPVTDINGNPITTRFTNPGGGSSDLLLFRLTADPGLPTLAVRNTAVASNQLVRIIGTGRARGSVTQSSTDLPPAGGYIWSAARDKAWGDNQVSKTATLEADGSGGNSYEFETLFEAAVNETQVTDKDSGSAAFAYNSTLSRWELAGITSAITVYGSQRSDSSQFGQSSIFLDLNTYRSQFPADVPEPGSLAVLSSVAAAGLLVRRRRSPAPDDVSIDRC